MTQVVKIIGSTIAVAALSACGGGGDSGATPSKFTQAEVKAVATLGLLAVEGSGGVVSLGFAYMGGLMESLAGDSGGSRSIDLTAMCTSGTTRLDVIKTAVRTGLISGDQVTVTADQCAVAGTGFVLNGVTKLTAQNTLAARVGGNYVLSFEAAMTGFTFTADGKTTQFDGVANAAVDVTGDGNTTSVGFAVPAGRTFSAMTTPYEAGKALPAISITYGAGTTSVASEVSAPNNASRKLDGSITLSTGGAPAMSLVISTPSILLGTTATGPFVATSGVIDTKATDENVATSTTVSGVRATVSGDTDGNGSLDLVFDSSWLTLMTP